MPVQRERSVGYAADRWMVNIEARADLKQVTKALYAFHLARIIEWCGREAPIARLDLHPYVIRCYEEGFAPRTIALDVTIAKMMFRWARSERLVPQEAVLRAPKLKIDANRFVLNHRTPTPSEAKKAIDAMPRDDWRLAALVIARTGARIGEVITLRSCDVDLHDGKLAFGAIEGASKTGLRYFPLDKETARDLAGRVGKGEEPLFHFEGTGNRGKGRTVVGRIQGLGRRLKWACDAAGVPRFSPHGLRRMVVARLMRARVDPATAATLTGHSIEVMLMHYQCVTDEDRREAAERANLAVLEDPPPRKSAA